MNRPGNSSQVRVSEEERLLLQQEGILPPDLQHNVRRALPLAEGRYLLEIPSGRREEVRDALTEALARIGFKSNYELTQQGRILEDLIDRFFVE
jgi:hypothetical protein